jgi:hypothetical protein
MLQSVLGDNLGAMPVEVDRHLDIPPTAMTEIIAVRRRIRRA